MPTAGTPYLFSDILAAATGLLFPQKSLRNFRNRLQDYLNVENIALVNSGTTAFYILLKYIVNLRKNKKQTQIILTNYTAPSLFLPIQKAGLECIVADISLQDFNIDADKIEPLINERTLAIMPVHMFGIPTNIDKIIALGQKYNLFIIEDAASSLGSKMEGYPSGTRAEFGFYSLNRGKNISTLAGGILTWKDPRHSKGISLYLNQIPKLNRLLELKLFIKFLALVLAVRPFFYTLLYPMIAKHKYSSLHDTFHSFAFTGFQAGLGAKLWNRAATLTQARIENGKQLINLFENIDGIQIPRSEFTVAYNQFPILIDDLAKRSELEIELLKAGIETSHLYEKTLHQIYWKFIKNSQQSFPQSQYLADHLLLLPPHPQIRNRHIKIISQCLNKIFT